MYFLFYLMYLKRVIMEDVIKTVTLTCHRKPYLSHSSHPMPTKIQNNFKFACLYISTIIHIQTTVSKLNFLYLLFKYNWLNEWCWVFDETLNLLIFQSEILKWLLRFFFFLSPVFFKSVGKLLLFSQANAPLESKIMWSVFQALFGWIFWLAQKSAVFPFRCHIFRFKENSRNISSLLRKKTSFIKCLF